MKARGLIWCICLGLGCAPGKAQSVLISSLRSTSNLELFQPIGSASEAITAQPPVMVAEAAPAVLPAMSLDLALPANPVMSSAFLGNPEAIRCSQPLPPRLEAVPYNAIEHLDLHPAAIRAAFTHDNLARMMRNFVPGQPLPDAPSYVPMTARQKWDSFVRRSHSGDLAFGSVVDAISDQATGAYPGFGGGLPGFGKRLGNSMAGAEAGAFFGRFLFPTLFHQDPRYFPSTDTRTSNRLAYAISRAFITRSDDGRTVINTSAIMSQFVQAAIANAYIPYRRETMHGTVGNAIGGLGAVVESNMLEEFWPDITSFFRKHQPQAMVRWQHRKTDPTVAEIASQ